MKQSSMLGSLWWIGLERAFRLVLGIGIGGLVGRYLGAEDYGRLQVVLTWAGMLTAVANLGLDTILAREFATANSVRASELFATAFVLRLLGAAVGSLILVGVGWLSADASLRAVVFASAIATFQPFAVIPEIRMQARGLNRASMRIQMIIMLAGASIRVLAVYSEAPVAVFAAVSSFEVLGLFVMFYSSRVCASVKFSLRRYSLATATYLLRQSAPLLISVLAAAIYQRIDLLLVQRFCTATEVGLYGVAVRMTEAAYFVPCALAGAAVPRLSIARQMGFAAYRKGYEACLCLAVSIGIILSVGFLVSAPYLVKIIYGRTFEGAIELLQIRGFVLFFISTEIGRTFRLIQEGKIKLVMYAHLCGLAVIATFGGFFVKNWGVAGGAWCAVGATAVPGWIAALLFSETRKDAWRIVACSVRLDWWWKSFLYIAGGKLDENIREKTI
ncbi:MAG: flippase [Nibricoccus sp.]